MPSVFIDLRTPRLEVRQDPGPEIDGSFGHSYRSVRIYHEEQQIAPLCCPDISLLISEMLPPP